MKIINKTRLEELANGLFEKIKQQSTYVVVTNHNIIGDGTTDNTATFQALVQRTDIQGKTLFFPKGTYIFGQVGLRDNLHFIGEPGTIFKLKSGSTYIFGVSNINNVKFENIDFWGGGTTNRPSTKGTEIGLNMSGSRRISLENCLFRGFSRTGLYVTNQGAQGNHQYSYNLMINACRFEQSYYGMEFGVRAEYANIVGSTCGQNYWGAFVGGGNNQFTNCQFNNNQNGLREVGGNIDGTNYPNNSHNSFTGCQYNHNGNNNGIALKLDNVEVGVMFTGCQFFYGSTEFTGTTTGVIFTGCEGGGNWSHKSEQTGRVMYTDCFFFSQPTIINPNGNTVYFNNSPNDIFDSSDLAQLSGDNVFTGTNRFDYSVPTVNLYKESHMFNVSGNSAANQDYYVNFNSTVPANERIPYIAIPMANGVSGDELNISVFVVNTETKSVVEYIVEDTDFTVISKEFNGQKCIIVPVNKTYTHNVTFGFRVVRKIINGRTVGLMYDNAGSANSCWFGSTKPNVGDVLTGNGVIKLAYAVVNLEDLKMLTEADLEFEGLAKLKENNHFTGENNFEFKSPTVSKYTNIHEFITGNRVVDSNYYASFEHIIPANTKMDALIIPIVNGLEKDSVNVSIIAINSDSKEVVDHIVVNKDFLVTEFELNNFKCIIVPINKTYDYNVSFGLRCVRKTVEGRLIGFAFNNTTTANTGWGGNSLPNIGTTVTQTFNVMVSYAVSNLVKEKLLKESDVDLDNFVKLSSDNNFTGLNSFGFNRPTVTSYVDSNDFTVMGVAAASGSDYWISFDNKIDANNHIDSIAIPISNGVVGYTALVSVFVANNTTKEFVEIICDNESFTVIDKEFNGQKCLVVPVNKTYNFDVSFGFKVSRSSGRGLMYDSLGSANSSWNGTTLPTVGSVISSTANFRFAYSVVILGEIEVVIKSDYDLSDAALRSENNTFTEINEFENYNPIVTRDFTIREFGGAQTNLAAASSHYYVNRAYSITANQPMSGLYLPIFNSIVGDTVEASYFVMNGTSFSVTEAATAYETYEVLDVEFVGCKCIRIPIPKTFSYNAGFGFSVKRKNIGGRQIGLAHVAGVVIPGSDSFSSAPSVGTSIGNAGNFLLPYQIFLTTSSEVVTKVEMLNPINAIPTFVVGELKTLAYDAGESIEIGGRTWLRCDGQLVSKESYPELASLMYTTSKQSDKEFSLPLASNIGYLYICTE